MISVSSYTYFCLQKMLNSACMQSLKYIPWISNYWSDTKLKTVVKKAELKKDSPVPAPSRTPPRKTLLANGSLSHTVSSRHTLSRSLCCRPQYVKVWFQRGFTARFTTAVLCFVLFLSSGSRYLIHKKKRSVSLRSVRSRRESLQSALYMEEKLEEINSPFDKWVTGPSFDGCQAFCLFNQQLHHSSFRESDGLLLSF